jgi:hypothetical protein
MERLDFGQVQGVVWPVLHQCQALAACAEMRPIVAGFEEDFHCTSVTFLVDHLCFMQPYRACDCKLLY